MIRSLYYTKAGEIRTDLTNEQIAAALKDVDGVLWVDFAGEPPEACEPMLLHTFGFHPLAVDDALRETHVPKVDDWGQYLYLVFHAFTFTDAERLKSLEMDAFLGINYVVTHHDDRIEAVERTWSILTRNGGYLKEGATRLLYRLVDEMVADYMPVFDALDDGIELLEDHVLENPSPDQLERILLYKRSLLQLRRILSPEREVLNKLTRDYYGVVDGKGRIFFRDIYDHLVRLHDINESMRDVVSSVLDIYLSVVNNRMNDIMKTLTMIATLFLPLSFIAGFFGMNFFAADPPHSAWTSPAAFVVVLAAMLTIPVLMYLGMQRRVLGSLAERRRESARQWLARRLPWRRGRAKSRRARF